VRAVDDYLAHSFYSTQLAVYDEGTCAPDLPRSDTMVGLYADTPVRTCAESLVGRALPPPDSAHIALVFPERSDVGRSVGGGHIDGLPAAHNGQPNDGRVHTFTLLAGVLLSDLPEPGNGNFTVWPGTHHDMARWFRTHGTNIDNPTDTFAECERLSSANPGVAITGAAGDVVFAHHLLVHCAGCHCGSHIRYAAFFRLQARPGAEQDDLALTNPWHEYVAMPWR
jgi:hypothetical protein